MFTGIIQSVGTIRDATPAGQGQRLVIAAGALDLSDVAIGDSIAVDGVCLTAVALGEGTFAVDVSAETIACTTGFPAGRRVNLEKALRLADRLGGHLVSGHVDGVATVEAFEAVGDNRRLVVRAPQALAHYAAPKGSATINGVSLTVNRVEGADFEINLIPHTLAMTNLGTLAAGTRVNLEVDMIARYVERLLASRR